MYKKSHHLSPLPPTSNIPTHHLNFIDVDIAPLQYTCNPKEIRLTSMHPSIPKIMPQPGFPRVKAHNCPDFHHAHTIKSPTKRVQTIRLKKMKKPEEIRKERLLFKFIQYTSSQAREGIRNNRNRRFSFAPLERKPVATNINYSNPKTESGPSSSEYNSGNERDNSNDKNMISGIQYKSEAKLSGLQRACISKKALKKKLEKSMIDANEDIESSYQLTSKKMVPIPKLGKKVKTRNKSAMTSLGSVQKQSSFLPDETNEEFVDDKACNIIRVVVTKVIKN